MTLTKTLRLREKVEVLRCGRPALDDSIPDFSPWVFGRPMV
jgi:hypothetical protein